MLPRSHLYWYSESLYDPLYLIQGPRSAVRAHLQHNLCNGTSFIQSCALREQNFLSLLPSQCYHPPFLPQHSIPSLFLPAKLTLFPVVRRFVSTSYIFIISPLLLTFWPAIRPVFIVFQLPLLGFGWRWRAESAITLRFKKPRPSRMRNTIRVHFWYMSKSWQLFLCPKTIPVDSVHLLVHEYIKIVIFNWVLVELLHFQGDWTYFPLYASFFRLKNIFLFIDQFI